MGGQSSKRKEVDGKLTGELPTHARFMLQELIETEEKYVKDLEHVCLNHLALYRSGTEIPTAIRGRERELFGNIESLMLFHRNTFLPKVRTCDKYPAEIGACFANHIDGLNQYSQFFEDTAHQEELLADSAVTEFFQPIQTEQNDVMGLQGYLMRPFQRLTRYRQLLEGFIKHMEPVLDDKGNDNLTFALRLVKYQLRHSNDLRALTLLKRFDGNLAEQGTLLLQEEFCVTDDKSKKKPRRIFLFEQSIIFSKPVGDGNSPSYQYKKCMKMSDIGLTENVKDNSSTFQIWYRKQKSKNTATLEAKNDEVKTEWVNEIRTLLEAQAAQLKERWTSQRSVDTPSPAKGVVIETDITPTHRQKSDP